MGLNFKLDVGLYQLDPAGRLLSVIGYPSIDANSKLSEAKETALAMLAQVFPQPATVLA